MKFVNVSFFSYLIIVRVFFQKCVLADDTIHRDNQAGNWYHVYTNNGAKSPKRSEYHSPFGKSLQIDISDRKLSPEELYYTYLITQMDSDKSKEPVSHNVQTPDRQDLKYYFDRSLSLGDYYKEYSNYGSPPEYEAPWLPPHEDYPYDGAPSDSGRQPSRPYYNGAHPRPPRAEPPPGRPLYYGGSIHHGPRPPPPGGPPHYGGPRPPPPGGPPHYGGQRPPPHGGTPHHGGPRPPPPVGAPHYGGPRPPYERPYPQTEPFAQDFPPPPPYDGPPPNRRPTSHDGYPPYGEPPPHERPPPRRESPGRDGPPSRDGQPPDIENPYQTGLMQYNQQTSTVPPNNSDVSILTQNNNNQENPLGNNAQISTQTTSTQTTTTKRPLYIFQAQAVTPEE